MAPSETLDVADPLALSVTPTFVSLTSVCALALTAPCDTTETFQINRGDSIEFCHNWHGANESKAIRLQVAQACKLVLSVSCQAPVYALADSAMRVFHCFDIAHCAVPVDAGQYYWLVSEGSPTLSSEVSISWGTE